MTMQVKSILLLLFLGIQTVWARPAQIILLRHAEKPDGEANVHLSDRGRERARALVGCLTTNRTVITNGLPAALFAPRISPRGKARRPYETLEPLADHLKLTIQMPYRAEDCKTLAKNVLNEKAYEGKTIVICWVHDYLPELAQALGVKPKPAKWKSSVYDCFWVVTWKGKETVLASLPQHLLPGDAGP